MPLDQEAETQIAKKSDSSSPQPLDALVGLSDVAAVEAALAELGVDPSVLGRPPDEADMPSAEEAPPEDPDDPFANASFEDFADIAADRAMGGKKSEPQGRGRATTGGKEESQGRGRATTGGKSGEDKEEDDGGE